jgi:hypothetical protein
MQRVISTSTMEAAPRRGKSTHRHVSHLECGHTNVRTRYADNGSSHVAPTHLRCAVCG